MSQCPVKVFSPAEAGREVHRSASTVKRVAAELRIEPLLTVGGARLFTADQVSKIKTELQRREQEATR